MGDGNDIALIDGSNSSVTLGQGSDKVIFAKQVKGVTINDLQVSDVGVSKVYRSEGTVGDDSFFGTNNSIDLIFAGSGEDLIYGFEETDILLGQYGDDTISGGSGDDFIIAGAGKDTLTGGAGKDSFIFNLQESSFYDFHSVEDFDEEQDLIYLLSSNFDLRPTTEVVEGDTIVNYKGKKVAELKDFSSSTFSDDNIYLLSNNSLDEIEDIINLEMI